MDIDSFVLYKDGDYITTRSEVEKIRAEDRKKANPLCIFAQKGYQEKALSASSDIIIGGGSRGCSKAQPYHSKVCTPDGFVEMGSLKVGDTISSVSGGTQKVICITEVGIKDVYRLIFSDGTFAECSDDHLWNVKAYDDSEWRTVSFKDIKKRLDSGQHSNMEIPSCWPVTFNTPDSSSDNPNTESYDYSIDLNNPSSRIDERFNKAPLMDRVTLMRSMIDKYAVINGAGDLILTAQSEELSFDIQYIVESIGGHTDMIKGSAGIYILVRHKYLARLFTSDRLKRMYDNARKDEFANKRIIVRYEYVGKDKCRCIAVSSSDELYITDHFIVTHNSFSMLMDVLKDINNQNLSALILRNERDDLLSLISDSYILFSQFGTYNKSISDMTWNFYKGGTLKFSYYADKFEDFKKRFQGKQYSLIAIDEITHCPYEKFKYLITDNRNAFGIKNRFIGTCNPDPDSWVRRFIDWWIGDDGFPILERSGVERYCYMDGDNVNNIYWGDTREEVYEQCRHIIDPLWKDAYAELGFDKLTMFIKSVTFIKGNVEENIKLISSDPNYVANLAQQDEEQRARDLEGNWNYKSVGDDMIKMYQLENMYSNSQQTGDGIRRASCDVAFTGGDSCVLWLWEGWHIKDIFVCKNDSKTTIYAIKAKLDEWGVLEHNFTYDLNGIGQSFKGFFPKAVPFNNLEAVDKKFKNIYQNMKSQCAYMLAQKIWDSEISIEERLLDLKFSGKDFDNMPLRQILMKERKCVRQNEATADKGFGLVSKDIMKKHVGHSPDYFESLFMRMIFELKHKTISKPKGLWML